MEQVEDGTNLGESLVFVFRTSKTDKSEAMQLLVEDGSIIVHREDDTNLGESLVIILHKSKTDK